MKINKVKTKKHIIAYIDLLGMKDTIKKDKTNKFLNLLNKIYRTSIIEIKGLQKPPNFNINIKIFSDNIVMAIEYGKSKKENKQNLIFLIGIVSLMSMKFLRNDILIRGGITIGVLHINPIFVYGKGLLDAYCMESELAIYPRVVVSSEIFNLYIVEYNKFIKQDHVNPKYNQPRIEKDSDGICYVSFYTSSIGSGIPNNIAKHLLQLKNKYANQIKITQKINWLINYHNKFCTKVPGLQECIMK
jgi:hypothetical protein